MLSFTVFLSLSALYLLQVVIIKLSSIKDILVLSRVSSAFSELPVDKVSVLSGDLLTEVLGESVFEGSVGDSLVVAIGSVMVLLNELSEGQVRSLIVIHILCLLVDVVNNIENELLVHGR